jgi:hypothetical protein
VCGGARGVEGAPDILFHSPIVVKALRDFPKARFSEKLGVLSRKGVLLKLSRNRKASSLRTNFLCFSGTALLCFSGRALLCGPTQAMYMYIYTKTSQASSMSKRHIGALSS